MSALNLGRDPRSIVRQASAAKASASNAVFVLPRWLRRPARLLKRLNDGEFTAPRFSATGVTAAFLAVTGVYGAYVGGHMPTYAQAVTARTGFAVDQVKVVGHKETSEIDILDCLDLSGWTSLIGFDAEVARARVAALPWVESASVRKVYPDEIEVQVTERQPFALWQHGAELSIVDRAGRVIVPFTGGHWSSLPQIIGAGAAEEAAAFLDKVDGYPQIVGRVKAYVRVGERRWDLKLNNGVTVKLPEAQEDEAMRALLALQSSGKVLSRDISAIDLRLPDRVAVQLTTGGLESRNAVLDQQAKARKKAGKA